MNPQDPLCMSLNSGHPKIPSNAYIAAGARLIGEVVLAPHASVWFNAVLRADGAPIYIGEGSNIQDLTMIHVDGWDEAGPGAEPRPTVIGNYVTVGHSVVLHSCVIEDTCLIGMNATVLGGVKIGRGSVIAAGAVVPENMEVPPFSLVAGVPGKIRKTYDEETVLTQNRRMADHYVNRTSTYIRNFGGGAK